MTESSPNRAALEGQPSVRVDGGDGVGAGGRGGQDRRPDGYTGSGGEDGAGPRRHSWHPPGGHPEQVLWILLGGDRRLARRGEDGGPEGDALQPADFRHRRPGLGGEAAVRDLVQDREVLHPVPRRDDRGGQGDVVGEIGVAKHTPPPFFEIKSNERLGRHYVFPLIFLSHKRAVFFSYAGYNYLDSEKPRCAMVVAGLYRLVITGKPARCLPSRLLILSESKLKVPLKKLLCADNIMGILFEDWW